MIRDESKGLTQDYIETGVYPVKISRNSDDLTIDEPRESVLLQTSLFI